jgi:hypothetical protein
MRSRTPWQQGSVVVKDSVRLTKASCTAVTCPIAPEMSASPPEKEAMRWMNGASGPR